AKAGPRTHAATIEGKSAQDWFADKAKAQGRDNLYATADGRPRQSTPPKTDFGALAADKPQTLSMPAEALFPTQPKPLDKSLPATPAAPPNFGNDKALAALSPDSGRSTMAMSPASLFPGASLPATPAATPAATHAVANAVEKKPKKDPKEGVPATGA
ncbi:MAG TPA: hypothetical protein VD994_19635, partial [Prosthecobacter sp.]|nr:hypothetical protein [Prosthecobacter sp.]